MTAEHTMGDLELLILEYLIGFVAAGWLVLSAFLIWEDWQGR
jgi:hypothetical protein